ncbi:SacI homology domain-containing protein [Globomyces pollinis-pini]|nr:SacI homology domain-containing protein [Globomyces pollinis-pini]
MMNELNQKNNSNDSKKDQLQKKTLVLTHFTCYETKARFYIVASNSERSLFKIAKVDKTLDNQVSFTDDSVVYSLSQMKDLLAMISNGNKSIGGLRKVIDFWGIFGFISFLEGYYMMLITKKSTVALIGGHYIYHIDETVMIPIYQNMGKEKKASLAELRYCQIFSGVDVSKNFYFSHTYDITQSLQNNLVNPLKGPNFLFVWNHYLTNNILEVNSAWYIPIIHGFVDQTKISVFGHNVLITLIARRSRQYAGARFLKRGVNEQGYVANDVETEQIVNDESTTTFSLPYNPSSPKPAYTSFLQHRGSIPLFWSQEVTAMAAKPLITMDLLDPFYAAAAKHFDDLFKRYGHPIIVVNLVKSKEKTKRESILLDEFTKAITYLNGTLPDDKKIHYVAWDMARASKSHDQDVIGTLEKLAEDVLSTTSIFHSGMEPFANVIKRSSGALKDVSNANEAGFRLQHGILRTNCIDCLDRTNAAQFVVGKCALGKQLYALGIIPEPNVPFDSDCINMFNAMYHDHGDTIALQYGGSHLVNTMETYRKMTAWTSHSRDMIESIKRYYSNSFADAEKQDSINLFLGNFIPKNSSRHLWDLPTDFYLHNTHPLDQKPVKSYQHWWTPDSPPSDTAASLMDKQIVSKRLQNDMMQMNEYYLPHMYTSLDSQFAYRMISTNPL